MHPKNHKKARAFLSQEKWQDALNLADAALSKKLHDDKALSIKALALSGLNAHEKAITAWQLLTQIRNLSVQEAHSCAISYRIIDKPHKALTLLRQLEKSNIQHFALFHNIANALADSGELSQAVDYYKKAISLQPDYTDAHINLNKLLWQLENFNEFGQSFTHSLSQHPKQLELRLSFVQLLLQTKRIKEAEQELNKTPLEQQTEPSFLDAKAQVYSYKGKLTEAISTIESKLGKTPFAKDHIINYIELLLRTQRFEIANEYIKGMREVHPTDQHILALQSYCIAQLFPDTPSVLTNYHDLIRVYDLPDTDSQTCQEFCEHLLDYLNQLHTAKHHPIDQSLRTGTQTQGNLFAHQQNELQSLQSFFSECIQDYSAACNPANEPYPDYSKYNTHRFSGSWSVQLDDKGYHKAHMHPMGWLSSVFYVQVPDICRDADKKEGWLHFGQPHFAKEISIANAKRCIAPVVGRLILFPSYMWHGTFPFHSNQKRTTIAFDVVKSY